MNTNVIVLMQSLSKIFKDLPWLESSNYYLWKHHVVHVSDVMLNVLRKSFKSNKNSIWFWENCIKEFIIKMIFLKLIYLQVTHLFPGFLQTWLFIIIDPICPYPVDDLDGLSSNLLSPLTDSLRPVSPLIHNTHRWTNGKDIFFNNWF